MTIFAIRLFVIIQVFLATANSKQSGKPETSAEVRQIVAQSICLIEGYPDSQMAKASKPALPTIIGDHNFAIAKCVLFIDQKEVQALLGK